jgi:Mg2+/Co2+ transporter CorC
MVPRVDIVGIAADTPLDEVVRLIQTEAHSRYPIYRESLDDVIGMIHIKDVLAYWGTAKKFNLRDILRRVVFVAPTLPVLDMLLDMRRSRTHMALVVDEFGGTDGCSPSRTWSRRSWARSRMSTTSPRRRRWRAATMARSTSTVARLSSFWSRRSATCCRKDERREIDTVGGLIFSLLGRIPERGEVVRHPSGRRVRSARRRPQAHPTPARAAADLGAGRALIAAQS